MNDNVIVGAFAGIVGGIIGIIYSHFMFLLGFSPISSVHIAASLVIIDILNPTTLGYANAIITHLVVAAAFGVLLTYILVYTGKDFWPIKGLGFGAFFCLLAHSYLIPLMRTDEQTRALIFNAPSWTLTISTHMLIGIIAAAIIVKTHYSLKK